MSPYTVTSNSCRSTDSMKVAGHYRCRSS
uniref:Uncharacterized protein n=1 Tax=Arundo donax TaxID=35708 RepID=A0A0A9FEQ0_ARUDO